MTLNELFELMHEIAEISGKHVCLGVQVRPNGSGRTTGGALGDGTEITNFRFGPSKLEWEDSHDGHIRLSATLRDKLTAARQAQKAQQPIFS